MVALRFPAPAPRKLNPAIIVHGGAGSWDRDDFTPIRETLRQAIEAGWDCLNQTNSSLEATIKAVNVLEQSGHFNAGAGSVPTRENRIETDAGLMRGTDMEFGGVACLRGFLHPIKVARDVLMDSPHVLVSGSGATKFAETKNHIRMNSDEVASSESPNKSTRGNTVGAVARDGDGNLAAATSTGGRSGQWEGRIGDTPIPGAGTYADSNSAISATGHGELITRHGVARRCGEYLAKGNREPAITDWLEKIKLGEVGLIGLTETSEPVGYHRTERMPHGWKSSRQDKIEIRLTVNPHT